MDERQNFENNYKLYRHRIYNTVIRYTRDVMAAEDLVSHTFMQAWVHRDDFRGDSSYSTWLTSIAINSALNYLSHKKSHPLASTYDCALNRHDDGLDTSTIAGAQQELELVLKAIEKLSLPMQEVMNLRVLYGLNYQEIANKLKIPLGTVRSRYHYARGIIKQSLQ